MDKIKIEGITIDFWSTLYKETDESKYDSDEHRAKIIKKLCDKYDKNISVEDIVKCMKKEQKEFYDVWITEKRTVSTEKRVHLILNFMEMTINKEDTDELIKKFKEVIFDFPPVLAPNVKDVLADIHSKGVPIALISDTGYTDGKNLSKIMEKDAVLQYFSSLSFSDETGVAKPQNKAYQKVKDDLNIKDMSKILHVGDLEYTDIKGANNFGMMSCLYTGIKDDIDKDNIVTEADFCIDDWKELTNYVEF